jgi:hypothetical protein
MARDITKVPAVAEGALKPFLYDFHYEREVAFDHNEQGIPIQMSAGKASESQHPLKSQEETGQSSGHNQMQLELYVGKGNDLSISKSRCP